MIYSDQDSASIRLRRALKRMVLWTSSSGAKQSGGFKRFSWCCSLVHLLCNARNATEHSKLSRRLCLREMTNLTAQRVSFVSVSFSSFYDFQCSARAAMTSRKVIHPLRKFPRFCLRASGGPYCKVIRNIIVKSATRLSKKLDSACIPRAASMIFFLSELYCFKCNCYKYNCLASTIPHFQLVRLSCWIEVPVASTGWLDSLGIGNF